MVYASRPVLIFVLSLFAAIPLCDGRPRARVRGFAGDSVGGRHHGAARARRDAAAGQGHEPEPLRVLHPAGGQRVQERRLEVSGRQDLDPRNARYGTLFASDFATALLLLFMDVCLHLAQAAMFLSRT
jgi:hypothetical protein